jgi:hypothetical protein
VDVKPHLTRDFDLSAFTPATHEDLHAMGIMYKRVIGEAANLALANGPDRLKTDTDPDKGALGRGLLLWEPTPACRPVCLQTFLALRTPTSPSSACAR